MLLLNFSCGLHHLPGKRGDEPNLLSVEPHHSIEEAAKPDRAGGEQRQTDTCPLLRC
jgi:hypothetical protein